MSGELVVVLLPGLDGTGKLFDRFLRSCPRQFVPRVVAYPGDEIHGYRELEGMVGDYLPRRRRFLIVAESFSGPLGITLASSGITNLVGVVLAASFVTPPRSALWKWLPWTTLFRLSSPLALLRWLLTGSDSELLRELNEATHRIAPRVLAARVRATLSVDARRHLARTSCPLLYIRARRDRIVSRRCLADILAVRKDVTVEELDSPHPVLQHQPDAAWTSIADFTGRANAD